MATNATNQMRRTLATTARARTHAIQTITYTWINAKSTALRIVEFTAKNVMSQMRRTLATAASAHTHAILIITST